MIVKYDHPDIRRYLEQEDIIREFERSLKKSNPYLLLYGMAGLWLAGTLFGVVIGSLYGRNWF